MLAVHRHMTKQLPLCSEVIWYLWCYLLGTFLKRYMQVILTPWMLLWNFSLNSLHCDYADVMHSIYCHLSSVKQLFH